MVTASRKHRPYSRGYALRQLREWIVVGCSALGAFGLVAIFAAILWALISGSHEAMQAFGFKLLTSTAWNPVEGREEYGLAAPLWGTLYSSAIALSLAVPIGVGTAVFLSQRILPEKVRKTAILVIEILASIPSVVYGLWGIFVVIPFVVKGGQAVHEHLGWLPFFGTAPAGPNLLAASVVLGIMILPIITAFSIEGLEATPKELEMAALGLGATRWEAIFRVVVPAALPSISGGIFLALGRAIGETMAVTMICGNANRMSLSVFDPATTLSSLIANQFAEASGLGGSALYAAALLLFSLSIGFNLIGRTTAGRSNTKGR